MKASVDNFFSCKASKVTPPHTYSKGQTPSPLPTEKEEKATYVKFAVLFSLSGGNSDF